MIVRAYEGEIRSILKVSKGQAIVRVKIKEGQVLSNLSPIKCSKSISVTATSSREDRRSL